MKRLLITAAACLLLTNGFAHDLITADATQAWLADLRDLQSVRQSSAGALRKAESAYRIGVVLETIRELLNQDLLAHGEVSGLASKYLIAELESRGFALDYSKPRRQFLSKARYFREALQMAPSAPSAPFAADAGYRLLDGLFQDHLGHDPLGVANIAAPGAEMIALAETLLADYPGHPRREEIEFIGIILYTRAARDCRKTTDAVAYLHKARQTIADFERHFPDSLRAAAMPVLREALARC